MKKRGQQNKGALFFKYGVDGPDWGNGLPDGDWWVGGKYHVS